MTKINWPHGPETLIEHLERFSTYLYRKRRLDIANLAAMIYGLYLHYKTDTGYYSEKYEDLNRPLKNKIHTVVGLDGLIQYGKTLIEKMQNDLNVVVQQ